MVEAFAVLAVDFTEGPKLVGGADELERALEVLVAEVKLRNPGVLSGAGGEPGEYTRSG